MSPLWASFRSFFICGLGLRVGLGDHGPGFSPPESQLMKESLALADPHLDLILCFQVMAQEFSVPERLRIAQQVGFFPKVLADGLESVLRQGGRPPHPLSFLEPGEAVILETVDPVLDGAGALPQKSGDIIRTHTGTGEENAVESMVVARFFGSLDFVLDGQPHDVRIRDFQSLHDGLLSEPIIAKSINMRNYL